MKGKNHEKAAPAKLAEIVAALDARVRLHELGAIGGRAALPAYARAAMIRAANDLRHVADNFGEVA